MADEIIIKYGADISKLDKELDNVESSLKGVDKAADQSMKNLDQESKKAAGSVGKVDKEVISLKSHLSNVADNLPFVRAAKEAQALATSMLGVNAATTTTITTMKVLRTAFMALGIGALVVAVASLIAYFTKTEKGAEKLEKWFAQLGATVDVIIGRFAKLAEGLGEFFSGDWSKAADTFGNAFKDIGKEIQGAAKEAGEFTEELQRIEDAQKLLRLEATKRRLEVQKLRIESKNQDLSDKQRLAKLEEAEAIETKIANQLIDLQKQKVAALERENALKLKTQEIDEGNKTDELIAAEEELINLEGEKLNILAAIEARKSSLRDAEREYAAAIRRTNEISKIQNTLQTKTEADFTHHTEAESKKRHAARVGEMQKFKKEVTDPMIKISQDAEKENTENYLKEVARRKQVQQQVIAETINLTSNLLNAINELQLNNTSAEIDQERTANQKKNEEQISNLEKRKEAGLISEKQFAAEKHKIEIQAAKREADLKRKQFEAEKRANINRVLIETAVAVAKSIAASPVTFGLPFSAFAIANGALQVALINAQQTPKFKDGVIDLNGPGTGTSDSITARLSKGESVMTAAETAEHKPLFNAIRKNQFDKYINENYLGPVLKREREKQRAAEKRQEELSGWVREMATNGNDLSHLERLTKSNKKVHIANAQEIGQEISKHVKPYKSKGL